MKTNPAPSALRRQRYARWMALWLAWAEAFFGFLIAHNLFSREARGVANGWLDRAAHALACMIVIDVVSLWPERARRTGGKPRCDNAAPLRSYIGSALRRTLRASDPLARIRALTKVLRNRAAYVRTLSRRLRRGLTRLWSAGALAGKTPSAAPLHAGEAPALHTFALDTS